MDIDKIKSSKDIFRYINDYIEYGWIDINNNKHIKTRGGEDSLTTEFYEVKKGLSFKEFNSYINHIRHNPKNNKSICPAIFWINSSFYKFFFF